jgi:hypothetical protein
VVARKVAGETFLVPIFGRVADMKGLFALNPVGSFIWERLDGTRDVGELSAAVVEEFEVDEPVAIADLREILEAFRGHGFIEAEG